MDGLAEGAAVHRLPPESEQVLLLCEKTDELAEATGLAPAVTAHRRETP